MRPFALLVFLFLAACSEPGDDAGPPAIVLAQTEVDVGRVDPGVQRRIDLPWQRTGRGALRVLAVETDCGCALAEGPRGPQDAGAHGTIVVRLRGARRAGPFRHRVTLYTDQPPPRDVVRAVLRGRSLSGVAVAPAALELGWRSAGLRLRRDAEVRLDAALDLADLTARLVGIEGSVRMLPPLRGDVPGRLLRIDITTPSAAGRFEGRVLLEQEGKVLGTLPIRGVVE